MRLTRRSIEILEIVFMAWLAGCASGQAPGGGSPGTGGAEEPDPGTGGSKAGTGGKGTGGSGGSGGSTVTPGTGGASMPPGTGGSAPDPVPDASTTPTPPRDAGSGGPLVDSSTPMSSETGPPPSYEGEIPVYYGPEVGPIVKMDCPEDPTVGWTEYVDSFNVQRPYDTPINKRFSITGGIYNFWVFPNDAPHSPTAMGRNPRTEARYGGTADVATGKNFQHGNRMWSGDMLIEKNAVNSAIFQIHTTASGGGPIGVRIQSNSDMVNNGSLTVVVGSSVQGGLIDRWFNFKAVLNADTLETSIYINNCLKKTYKGDRGDGNFYFKHGVYFCKTSTNGCFSHYKNIHLYKK